MTILATNEKTGVPAKFATASSPGIDQRRGGSTALDVGPNAIADVSGHALGRALEKFWSPVPWMLEGAIALELVMGKFFEATVIGVLFFFNAGLSYFQGCGANVGGRAN
jgi:H+-transporting ATPase